MKRLVPFAVLLAVAVSAGTLGVASAMSNRPSQDVTPTDRGRCFDPKFLRGFQNSGDNKIVITSDSNQAYELTLGGACIGLDSAYMIGVQSRFAMSEICGPFDANIVYNGLGMNRVQQCPIIAMRHLQGNDATPYVETRQSKSSVSSSGAAHSRAESQ